MYRKIVRHAPLSATNWPRLLSSTDVFYLKNMFFSAFATWQRNQHHLRNRNGQFFEKKAHRIAQHPVFRFFPVNLMSSTYTDKNILFSRCTNKYSQLEIFSESYFNRIFSDWLSLTSKGYPYRFLSRGTTGSSTLDHDFVICVVGESNCLDISILKFLFDNFWNIFTFDLGISRYCISCLCWHSGYGIHDLCYNHVC